MSAPTMSKAALARVRAPRTRGAVLPIEAARRQLGLLAVGDGEGQARISWLIDLSTDTVADSRFLAFGDFTSHAVADVFTETVRGRSFTDACALPFEPLEALLRDDPVTPAFGDAGLEPFALVRRLQDHALAARATVALLPKPMEKDTYQRKRKADWTAEDQAWLPLSLLRKTAKADAAISEELAARAPGATATITALNDDFRIVLRLEGVAAEAVPTLIAMLQERLRRLHAQLTVEATP